ncbi:L-asparaginase [candidate division KSB3 bacterium]|uniref:L-asparaginase n=1 Tax=candidate division KSB3 bacterium TaxID=2044937 RepID=A0A2G6E1U7_9BACT|nr:MAG: L-asparaginase [candidate division KSB3 bacterium]PIE28647.1 MAG: L-asparaginase [candidate division KSB3 bacterium]
MRHANRGEILLFFTGGTICMRPRDGTHDVIPSGDFQRFFDEVSPHIREVTLRPILWSDLPSPHMTPGRMFRLAKDVESALEAPETLGAVIIHGTDVLVESAFMADIILASTKPVIYTGSMRYFSESGYDGVRNLLNSIKACLLPLPPEAGVVLLMTDRLFAARDVIKVNALNIDAFDAPESGPVGHIAGEDVVLSSCRRGGYALPRPRIRTETLEENVPVLTCYTGMDGSLIEYLHRQKKIAGLVVEGFGAGNVPPMLVPALEKLIDDHIPVVLTTQCHQGGVWPIYAYPGGAADLRKKGVLLGGRLSAAKARIQLMAALGAKLPRESLSALYR